MTHTIPLQTHAKHGINDPWGRVKICHRRFMYYQQFDPGDEIQKKTNAQPFTNMNDKFNVSMDNFELKHGQNNAIYPGVNTPEFELLPCRYDMTNATTNHSQIPFFSFLCEILTLLMLEMEYSCFGGQYHTSRCPGSWNHQSISRHSIVSTG